MSVIRPAERYDSGGERSWLLTPSGLLVRASQMPRPAPIRHADIVLKYWKVQLSAADLLDSTEGLTRARGLLTRHSLTHTLAILSKAALVLAQSPYQDMMRTQQYLAAQFFEREILNRADSWIREHRRDGEAYLFSEQQLLLAMCVALLDSKGTAPPLPGGGPLATLGEALLHVSHELDPLEAADPGTAAREPEERRRLFIEFILRKGIFYADDDYRYAVARYHSLLCELPQILRNDANLVDIPGVFRRTTGLSIQTYLAMGLGLLSPFRLVGRQNAHDTPVLLDRRQLFRTSNLRGAARRFLSIVSTDARRFRRAMRLNLQRYGNLQYNFLEAERHPLVEIKKYLFCCLSIHFLERKFSSGIHHIVLEGLPAARRKRYFDFFGVIFERYVQDTLERIFTEDRFVRGFKYGRPERQAGDGWIVYPGAAVVLEAKSSRFTLDTRLSGSLGSVERLFRDSIVGGARQLNRVIEDFRAGAFTVHGQGPAELPVIYPVLVTLQYVPLEHFLADYIRGLLRAEKLLQQQAVRPLVLLPVKEVEYIEGMVASGASFINLLQEYVDHPQWHEWPFSNFRHNKFPDGLPGRGAVVERTMDLMRRAGYQLFGAWLDS